VPDVARLLAEEERGWRELHGLFEALPTDAMEQPDLTPEGWSAKDLMCHIGAWMADCANQLERMRMGTFEDRVDTAEDIERMNREFLEASRMMDVRSVIASYHSARNRMLQEFMALPEITPAAWEWFEESGPLHYAKHVADLRAWAESLGG
jgi:hypothetical protein